MDPKEVIDGAAPVAAAAAAVVVPPVDGDAAVDAPAAGGDSMETD